MPKGASSGQGILPIRLVCLRPPADEGATFGIQERDGTLHPGQAAADGSVSFEIPVTFRRRDPDDAVRLAGPFVHGTAVVPFLYLSLKRLDRDLWIRRLKIPLPILTWARASALAGHGILVGHVSGAGSGTVPLEGNCWQEQAL